MTAGPVTATVAFREARRDEVPAILALLRDDMLGQGREGDDLAPYLAAYDAMQAEAANHLIVGLIDAQVIACYQITFIAGLSLSAARRAQIEGVRVRPDQRGRRIGEALIRDAEARARTAGCTLLQFTTNRSRSEAHRFYDRLGFTPSHIGYKKSL
ncbi:GNAT family N-acetyltransferase [Paracoccus denitrificans]|nr:GNAT family N-acetyltransferase [Paracoccus denitrificans]MCU7429100.1 GNAT family N-acetyltransferase [Paracoccus denitrificans]GEK70066.1 N-acetyltransferase [Paracoccus denitrificans]SDJ43845.1 N-acetylglutamate synthase, GNAT family [Paracoccus denitrificans]SFR18538.1 N-acetylglutamate synthase, GNAT family [Paracoccus denitrificans]